MKTKHLLTLSLLCTCLLQTASVYARNDFDRCLGIALFTWLLLTPRQVVVERQPQVICQPQIVVRPTPPEAPQTQPEPAVAGGPHSTLWAGLGAYVTPETAFTTTMASGIVLHPASSPVQNPLPSATASPEVSPQTNRPASAPETKAP